MSDDQLLEGTWARLSQVAVKGAQYNSPERYPHPKCLEGTRVDLLKYIHGCLDNLEQNQLIWLHGTAGVGKSSVAFTVAEKMRGLKVTEETNVEKRLGGTFFFSREKTGRRTAGFFFATLVYQLATNFPSIRKDVNRVIRDNPALLDPNTPLCDQMEALFLKPLRWLRPRLRGCPPVSFVVDALDECTSEPELTDLILSLARSLRDPDLPATHILLTSRSESHISKVFQKDEVRPLVCEIPVRTGEDNIISLDGTDVDNDICTFLQYSFRELESRHPDFPQPSKDDLAKLASRAGRRFIVASTMMKFIIDDEDNDPRDRVQLMLELTSELLPGTEVYKLYDCILSTCTDPKRAYLHLSLVAALTDPLPISQISTLLGPGFGRDVQTTLTQLRSVMDIPTDSTLPVNIYHSSIRDYASDPSNCGLPQVRNIASPHSLLARSSLRLMNAIPKSTALLDALSELKKQSNAMQPRDHNELKDSLVFLQPLEPLPVVICMLWLREGHTSDLHPFLETMGGHAWLQTQAGRNWLQIQGGHDWLQIPRGQEWLLAHEGQEWMLTQDGHAWLQTRGGREWLQTRGGQEWLPTLGGRIWLLTLEGQIWLRTLQGREWLQTVGGRKWLWTPEGRDWRIEGVRYLLLALERQDWLQTHKMRESLVTQEVRESLVKGIRKSLVTLDTQEWLQFRARLQFEEWLQTEGGRGWLQTLAGREWLQTQGGREWLQTQRERDRLQTQKGRDWPQTQRGQDWLQTEGGRDWLQTQRGRDWLQTQGGRDWLQTQGGRDWLRTPHGEAWQSTPAASVWVTVEEFLRTSEAMSKYIITGDVLLLPAFQVIQQLKTLPDFLMFPVFLALRHHHHSAPAIPESLPLPDREIIHAMDAFKCFANDALERSRTASDALKYACHNWALHLSRAPNPWDDTLNHIFQAFCNNHMIPWLEMEWCLKGLRSCLVILSEGQKIVFRRSKVPTTDIALCSMT